MKHIYKQPEIRICAFPGTDVLLASPAVTTDPFVSDRTDWFGSDDWEGGAL